MPTTMITILPALLIIFTSIVIPPFVSSADDGEQQRWIQVTGEGAVDAPPDLAILRLEVMTIEKSPQEATSKNNAIIARVLKDLTDNGIPEKDLETTNFKLSPQREYRKNLPPLVTGYQASNSLMIKIRDLEKVGKYMQLAIEAGGNNFESLSFTVEDSKPLIDEARVKAMKNALDKAEMMTEALNVGLGPPLVISEISQPFRPVQSRRMVAADAYMESDVPVQIPNELSVNARVQVKFALE